jgi:RND family efflux transporter MFP subunit
MTWRSRRRYRAAYPYDAASLWICFTAFTQARRPCVSGLTYNRSARLTPRSARLALDSAAGRAGFSCPINAVPAPIDGVVLARMANLGLVVSKAQELFTVADLSRVWVMASLNEKDFAFVHVGSAARITTPAYAGRVWNGRVAYIDPQVDPNTRTAQARIEVANPRESLRFQMYVDVEFTSQGAVGTAVPEAAVQSIGDRQFVFLPIKDNEGSFTMRVVRLGPKANGYYAAGRIIGERQGPPPLSWGKIQDYSINQ